MGSGSYSHAEYCTRSAVFFKSNARETFRAVEAKKEFDVRYIKSREARDSVEHPSSTPISLWMDCTASMDFASQQLLAGGLGDLMQGIHQHHVVTDPQILLGFVGDVRYDRVPLQATQYESDLRIIQQITSLYMERGGGINDFESYNLPWYFASRYAKLDCVEKRQKKAYLFCVGDENVPADLTPEDIKKAFGTTDTQHTITNSELLEEVSRTHQVFHIIAEQGSYPKSLGAMERLRRNWGDLMGRRAIFMRDVTVFGNLVLTIIRVCEGEELNEVIESFHDRKTREELRYSLPW